MRVAIGVVARDDVGASLDERRDAVAGALEVAGEFVDQVFPSRTRPLTGSLWMSPLGQAGALLWSNEGERRTSDQLSVTCDRWLSLIGYSSQGLNLSSLLATDDLLERSTGLPGCFALLRVSDDGVEAITDITRSNNIYAAETDRIRIVATRALLAKLVAAATVQRRGDPFLSRDPIGHRHMAVGGYYLGNTTPFVDVEALPPATQVTLIGSGRSMRSADVRAERRFGAGGWATAVDATAEHLVRAFDVIGSDDLHLSLTGGRDSRILAAALVHRSDFNVATATSGRPDDPDVVIAGQIASILGFPHNVYAPGGVVSEDEVWAEDPLARIVRNLDIHDGMTSAWDDIADYPQFVSRPAMSGVGGEILRGGLVLPEVSALTPELVTKRLRNVFIGGRFIHSEIRNAGLDDGAAVLELAQTDPHRAADEFYRIHRNGRWVSARRSGARVGGDLIDPLLDNRFVRSILTIDPERRWQERLAFDLIVRLAPSLRDVPVEGKRWRFERASARPEASASEAAGWSNRHAIARTGSVDRYLWQKLGDPSIRQRVSELILDGAHGPAAGLFDTAMVEKALAAETLSYPAVVWNIATSVVSLTVPWYKTVRPQQVRPHRVRWLD